MKSRKNTIKRGGGLADIRVAKEYDGNEAPGGKPLGSNALREVFLVGDRIADEMINVTDRHDFQGDFFDLARKGGSKRKSRKSKKAKKTKKGRGSHEGGKKKCPKHCRRKTRHTRKRLKHRKN